MPVRTAKALQMTTRTEGIRCAFQITQTKMLFISNSQEGVSKGWYFPKNVTVTTPMGETLVARTYQQVNNPNKTASSDLPKNRRPSNTYLEVSLKT